MSLLSSLVQAGTDLYQAAGSRTRQQGPGQAGAAGKAPEAAPVSEGKVTLNGGQQKTPASKLAVDQYKSNVGQDHAFVRDTLRHKIAEYDLNPAIRLGVEKADNGKLQIKALMPENLRQQIEKDLNNNQPFREAFGRLSVNEPTLSFVDNAMKLNAAYGVNNSLLDQLVSDNQQFNGLQDIAHRYDSLRRNIGAQVMEAAGNESQYAFSLNARA